MQEGGARLQTVTSCWGVGTARIWYYSCISNCSLGVMPVFSQPILHVQSPVIILSQSSNNSFNVNIFRGLCLNISGRRVRFLSFSKTLDKLAKSILSTQVSRFLNNIVSFKSYSLQSPVVSKTSKLQHSGTGTSHPTHFLASSTVK